MTPKNLPRDLPAKFWSRTRRVGDCVLWTGTIANGYGRFHIGNNIYVPAHRFAWELENGPISPAMTIDHVVELCSNKHCVNTDHMEVVTRAENTRRARRVNGGKKCQPGCTCKRHLNYARPKCKPDCKCSRHKARFFNGPKLKSRRFK